MFRSRADTRHLALFAKGPTFGNNMALFSRDGPVSAPCVPGPIRPSLQWKARLKKTLTHSNSVPLLSEVPREDEISEALGLQSARVLEYSRPVTSRGRLSWGNSGSQKSPETNPETNTETPENPHTFENLASLDNDFDQLSLDLLCSDHAQVSLRGHFSVSREGETHPFDLVGLDLDTPDVIRQLMPQQSPHQITQLTPQPRSNHIFLSRHHVLHPSHSSSRSTSKSSSPRNLIRALNSSARLDSGLQGSDANTPKPKPKEMSELQYLVTYNLVNNFYYNLVSWSSLNNAIAIAIDSKAYWWDGSSQVKDMNIQRPGLAPVSCVACSKGDTFAIAYSDGFFSIHHVSRRRPPVTVRFSSSVQCVEWFPDGKRLVTGDQTGSVALWAYDSLSLDLVTSLEGFSQQICGISISRDASQVAVGANENLAIVWDITNQLHPEEQCRLRHGSAVKGILFCPWAPNLLATGGGSNDRHLRFWHTATGTLLKELDTRRQITAVFWSAFYKEILLTFGFLGDAHHVAASVYLYPELKTVAHAHARDPLRALSATVSPDETKVAIAANDGTVRVFGLWKERPYPLTESPLVVGAGSYGSLVVESFEGIHQTPVVR